MKQGSCKLKIVCHFAVVQIELFKDFLDNTLDLFELFNNI